MYDFQVIEQHPNPQFYRKDFLVLDGEWMFSFDREDRGRKEQWQRRDVLPLKINVPFVYQSKKSGIDSAEFCPIVWYKRKVVVPEGMKGRRIILHFLAVDYECDVWVNGLHAVHHVGGYTAFETDITYLLEQGENDISVRVYDNDFAKETMRGKQLWGKGEFGCWYKRYTGIWQSVWIEAVDKVHIEKFVVRTCVDTNTVQVKAQLIGNDSGEVAPEEPGSDSGEALMAEIDICVGEVPVASAAFQIKGNYINESISVDYAGSPFRGCEWWSPEHPALYRMCISLKRGKEALDLVQTYFGMRKLEAYEGKVLLNNFPFVHRSILNQGYYPEGYITAEDDERIISDIKLIKSLGYNAMRIHEKIESPRFLYWCDRLGIAVWEEMPSMYQYRELEVHRVLEQITAAVERDINHPCITAWVMFNESWGVQQVRFDRQQQNLVNAAYYAVKSMDPTRFVIGNDGWQNVCTDLVTIHDYSAYGEEIRTRYENQSLEEGSFPVAGQRRYAFAEGYHYSGQPVMLTEYGGISYAADGGWGYNGKVGTEEEFIVRFASLTDAIKDIPYMCGYCFTQFTDVENEQNGLVTIDRKSKVSAEKICNINLR